MGKPEKPFRLAEEMGAKGRVPLSTRVKTATRSTLKTEAKQAGQSLAELTANVLDDYAEWLRRKRR